MADAKLVVNSIVLVRGSGHLGVMKTLCFVFVVMLTLSACAPAPVYYREGASMAKMEDDLLNCKVAAVKDAPVATELRRGAPRYYPGYLRCNNSGHCYRTGGYFYPGEVYSVDVNASLRRDLENRCMARKGYAPVELPRCRAGTVGTVTTDQTTGTNIMPPLSENSCIIDGNGGPAQIIDPAL